MDTNWSIKINAYFLNLTLKKNLIIKIECEEQLKKKYHLKWKEIVLKV